MKFSTAAILGMAPLALAKSVHNVAPAKRDGHLQQGHGSVKISDQQLAELTRLLGLHKPSHAQINFLWVNLGGEAATTVIGQASTVTVTQTVQHEATPPPAVHTGEPGTPVVQPPPNPVAGAGGATHSVTVGGPQGLAFSPQELKASIGDTVIFTFLSQNHTATQSAFDTPCDPLDGGMDSGFQANANNTVNPPPQVAMQVMVDTPLWFYCRQGNHCGKGMVFSINPNAEKTHAMFQALAIQQRGNGAGGAITGNGPAPDPNAAPAPAPTGTDVPAPANTGLVPGVGKVGADGSCQCVVQCSFGGFPNVAVQGRDSFGGYGGGVPMAMVGAAPAPAKKFRA